MDNSSMLSFEQMHKAVNFYIENGFRPMPLFDVAAGCKHRPKIEGLDCQGQCYGKVPIEEHWPDKKGFTSEDFPTGCNLGLIMGQQLDGRWFIGFDIDGILSLDEFLILPPTLECITNRGRHLIYEVTKDSPLGNWNDIFSTRSETLGYRSGYNGALDLKFCRGAMTSPPSRTRVGSEYKWIEWRQPEFLPDSEIKYLIRKRKFAYPHITRYRSWSANPSHKNKRA